MKHPPSNSLKNIPLFPQEQDAFSSQSIPIIPYHLFEEAKKEPEEKEKSDAPYALPPLSPNKTSTTLALPPLVDLEETLEEEAILPIPLSPRKSINNFALEEIPLSLPSIPRSEAPTSPVLQQQESHPLPEKGEFSLFFEGEREEALRQKTTKQSPAQKEKSPGLSGRFNNVNVVEFINFLGQATGKNFVFDENDLQFAITVITSEEESLDNLLALLMQELQVRNLSLSEQGNTILIHPNKQVRSPGEIVIQPHSSESEILTRVFSLNTLDPAKVSEIVKPLLSADASVLVLRDSNKLIVTDLQANIEKIDDLIQHLDAPIGGMEIGQYVSEYGIALSLVQSAEQILQPIAQGNPLYLIPHQPTNSIFVIANPFLVERAVSILRYLDTTQGETRILNLEEWKRSANLSLISDYLDEETKKHKEEDRRRRLLDEGWQYDSEGNLVPPGSPLTPQGRIAQELPEQHIGRTLFFIYKLQYRN